MATAHEIATTLRSDVQALWDRAPLPVRIVVQPDVLQIMARLDELIDLTDEGSDDGEG